MQHTRFVTIYSRQLEAEFNVHKAIKHSAISSGSQSAVSAAQPGDFVAMDRFFNMFVFSRQQFKKAFGHAALQLLDDLEEV
jgi:hypothetical protein